MPDNLSGLASSVRTYYAGREYDFYTDLYNNRARWYDAAMQRFISEDPIGFAGGDPNLYRYCGNSPINATDPSGCIINVVAGAGIGGVVGGGGYLLHAWLTGQDANLTDFCVATAAGVASGALAGATLGASLIVQGALAGATYGAINSGFTTAAHTGDWGAAGRAALQGGAIGAAAGAVGGGVAGGVLGKVGQNFLGYTAAGLAGGVAAGGTGGGIGGYMQTGTAMGTLKGAGLGALEGGILGAAGGAMVGGARAAGPAMASLVARSPASVRNFAYTQIVGGNLALRSPNMAYSRMMAGMLRPPVGVVAAVRAPIEPAPHLPPFSGGKTSGVLRYGDTNIPLLSGYKGPSASLPKGTPGMNGRIKSHVEAHTAAIMRQKGLTEATLYINRVPCSGKTGCNAMLPRMLPEGAGLRVIGPDGFDQVFVGLPD